MTTTAITPDSLMSLEACTKARKTLRPEIIAHRKLRSVLLAAHINLQFEDEKTVRQQIQEMLRIEKIFEEEGIQSEIDADAPLVPDGHNWKATPASTPSPTKTWTAKTPKNRCRALCAA